MPQSMVWEMQTRSPWQNVSILPRSISDLTFKIRLLRDSLVNDQGQADSCIPLLCSSSFSYTVNVFQTTLVAHWIWCLWVKQPSGVSRVVTLSPALRVMICSSLTICVGHCHQSMACFDLSSHPHRHSPTLSVLTHHMKVGTCGLW